MLHANTPLLTRLGERIRFRLKLGPDSLLALLCGYWALTANWAFLRGAHDGLGGATGTVAALVPLLALLHFVLLAPWVWRPWGRPLLAVLALVAAVASYFTQSLGAVLDPAMLRNALRTDWPEARELLTPAFAWHVLWQVLPAWWLIHRTHWTPVHSQRRRVLGALLRWVLALAALLGLLLLLLQPLSGLMRNHKGLRYQLAPAAPLYSLPRSLVNKAQDAVQVREAIGLDAQPGPSWAQAPRPRLLVLVVGETVRAANWGERQMPDGSTRDTTPRLRAQTGLLHWPVVTTCGTDTETSVPCMFNPVGRRDYDEKRIRRQESLLHVLARAGVGVQWIDNQSGCKGVCDGLPMVQLECPGGRCLDEALTADLDTRLAQAKGTQLLVLHMLGNHGPAYYRRVPPGFEPYRPYCANDDLSRCERSAIVNAFDNAIRYQDEVLAALWQRLQAAQHKVDTALLFLPDHGESLGEKGLFLHGMPYAIAPREQTEVPMVLGIAPAWAEARGWSPACLQGLSAQPLRHDHLFHTVLTLLDVKTALHEPDWDILQACARPTR